MGSASTPLNVIYTAGISISLFISALLLRKKQKSGADAFLLAWMLLLAIHLYLYSINFTGPLFKVPQLLGIEIPLPLIHGVLLYYYVAAVTQQFPKRKWAALLHLLPISVGYLYLIPLFRASPAQKIEIYSNSFEGYQGFMDFGLWLIFLSGIVYVLWCSWLLHRHKRNIRHQFSDIEAVSLGWLQLLVYGLGAVWSIVIFTNKDAYIFTGVTVFVILIGFFGVQQSTIFVQREAAPAQPEKATSGVEGERKKYARSGLKAATANDTYERLLHLFTVEAYYKKNELSLRELALELDMPPNHLSQIINEKTGKNFYDFVNTFRLEAFKQRVQQQHHQEFTLLALAYECGFNSKSSFNRYFKKHTGQTPSEFAKSATGPPDA